MEYVSHNLDHSGLSLQTLQIVIDLTHAVQGRFGTRLHDCLKISMILLNRINNVCGERKYDFYQIRTEGNINSSKTCDMEIYDAKCIDGHMFYCLC